MPLPRLLLLPGMLNTAAVFAGLVPRLQADAVIHVVDGFRTGTLADMAAAAFAVAGAGPLHVAGFSMGGYVALEMLAVQPDRIAGLALIGSSIDVDNEEGKVLREKWIRAAKRDFPLWVERTIDAGLHPSRKDLLEFRDAMRPQMLAIGPVGFEAQVRAAMARRNHLAMLSQLHIPVAVIASREDQVRPLSLSDDAARTIPGARLTVIENAGHMTVLETPEAVAAPIRHWLTLSGGGT